MNRQSWTFVAIFSTLVVVAYLGFTIFDRGVTITGLKTEIEAQKATAEAGAATAAEARARLAETGERVAALERERDEVMQTQKGLEAQMRTALQSRDVAISELKGKLTVNILDRILFDSGESTLKPEGEQVLREIAGVLTQYPKRQIHVIGHTDNVPIRATAWSRHPSNWELSTARATAAVRFLHEKAGVDPQRLGAVGHGEFRPVADNSTIEGRAKNRRIAIVVLPEEFSAVDSRNSQERIRVKPSEGASEKSGIQIAPALESPAPVPPPQSGL